MVTKHTILTNNDHFLLEQVILNYGQVVNFAQLEQVFARQYSRKSDRKRRVAFLAEAGWLVRIKKGLYLVVTELTSRAIGNTSNLVISNALNPESYVSFANALNFHGMFDQLTRTVDAITHVR